jgi:RNA polymerase sigma-70 factor (ECF subfamily)
MRAKQAERSWSQGASVAFEDRQPERQGIDREGDRALAARLLDDGDERAFNELYERHTPALYGFVLRVMGGDEIEAEDVVQDAWVRGVGAIDRFRWESSFRTWLLGIGLNCAREAMRRRSRRETVIPVEEAPVSTKPPRHVPRVALDRAIEALPDAYRIVLVLHDIEGFTHVDIGEKLGIAPGTSKSQLHRARRMMRGFLAK